MLDTLNSIGLQDPHRQLQKELDSWDIWNIEETDRKKDLKKMCSQWLDRYFPPSTSLLLLLCVCLLLLFLGGGLGGGVSNPFSNCSTVSVSCVEKRFTLEHI